MRNHDDDRRDAQFDPHNKQPANAKRIRMSWIVVVLMFVALALTALLIASRQ
jgi:hypothetical protein